MIKNSTCRRIYTFKAASHTIELGRKTRLMGIVNCTPDSFSHDGCLRKNYSCHDALELAYRHMKDGADILDIGGESTRPGSERIDEKEEVKRVIPVIKKLAKKIKIPISIDTYKPEVAHMALDQGASIVNNIMGSKPNKKLLEIIKKYDAGIVLMHIRGTPKTMQKNIAYSNLINNIITKLRQSVENCLEIGIKSDKIIIDPGIGFGKTVEDNCAIINHLKRFNSLKKPILIGASRKSFIGKILNREVQDRLYGTIASCCASILNGAHILRVHDVKAIKEAAILTDAIINQ